jgi:hypothetical protein
MTSARRLDEASVAVEQLRPLVLLGPGNLARGTIDERVGAITMSPPSVASAVNSSSILDFTG